MREGTNRQDYINTILAQIDQKQMREEIEKELSAHIDDREEYYREIGFDSDTAAEKALERMGSPEAAADGFNKVHKNYRRAVAILAVIASVFVIPFFWFIIIFFCIDDSVMGAGITEALFLLYIIGLSVLGKRRNSRIVCAVAIVDFIIMYGNYLYMLSDVTSGFNELCSRIVLKLTCLLTFDFDCLSAFWRVGGITVAPYLTYLSIAFYTAVFILLILVQISIGKLKKPTYGLRTKHFASRVFKVQKAIWIFIAATILILPVGSFDKNEGMTVKTKERFDSIIIAQSDTPCPLSEIPKEDIVTFNSNYDLVGPYIFYLDSPSANAPKNIAYPDQFNYIFGGYNVEKKIGNKLTYKIGKFDIPCSFTKDYVYIEFLNSGTSTVYDDDAYEFASNNPENWYEVESAGEISAAVDAYNQIEIRLTAQN